MFRKFKLLLDSHLRLSLFSFYLFSPISISAVPFAFSFKSNSPTLAVLFIYGFIITIFTLGVYSFLITISKYLKKTESLAFKLGILTITGTSRGLIFYIIFELSEIENPSPILGRVLNSIFTVVLWLGLTSILIESNDRFKRKYRAIITHSLLLKLRDSKKLDPGFALLARDIARMQLNIKSFLQKEEFDLKDEERASFLAQSLRNEIENIIKPLSQRLWIKTIHNAPALRVSALILSAARDLNYPFALTALIFALANVANATQNVGLFKGIHFAIVNFLAFLALESLRKNMCKKFINQVVLINLIFLGIIGLIVPLVSNRVLNFLGLHHSFVIIALASSVLPFLIIMIASIKLAYQDRESLIHLLRKEIDKSHLEDYYLISHGNAASYLHNSLQSELTALALQLDSLALNPDPERNQIVMEKLEALVSQSKSEDFKNFMETPEKRLNRVVSSWDGIAEIHLKVDPLIWQEPSRSSIVVSLIQEAVANSVRSGRANRVDVVSEYSKDSIFVTITDNGQAEIIANRRGIGSQWIDRIAISDWKLEETENGRVLRVEI